MEETKRGVLTHSALDTTIYLNKGMPSDDILGRHLFEASLVDLSRAPEVSTSQLLNYGDDGGPLSFREALSVFLNRVELRPGFSPFEARNFFSTAGNSHALSVVCTMLLHDGPSTVLCDDPTYPFALCIFRDHRATLASVPMVDGQTHVAGMRRQCEEARQQNRPVKMVYVVPSFHNPTGSVMSLDTRMALVELAHEFDFFLVCDDVYQLLYFGTPPPPLAVCLEQKCASEQCRVLSLGTFSKIFAPGIRAGWLQTYNESFLEKMAQFGELQSGGGYSAVANRIAERMLVSGRQEQLLEMIRKRLAIKCDFLCNALTKHLGTSVEFDRPEGGYFVWVKLTGKSDSQRLYDACMALKPFAVKFFDGNFFSPLRLHPMRMRLSFALYDEAQLESGVRAIATAFEKIEESV